MEVFLKVFCFCFIQYSFWNVCNQRNTYRFSVISFYMSNCSMFHQGFSMIAGYKNKCFIHQTLCFQVFKKELNQLILIMNSIIIRIAECFCPFIVFLRNFIRIMSCIELNYTEERFFF